jgi:hypothetical protein
MPTDQGVCVTEGTAARRLAYREFRAAELSGGQHEGTAPVGGGLRFARPAGTAEHRDPWGTGPAVRYEWTRWTAPVVDPGFDLGELVACWQATTPGRAWLEVAVAVADADREHWYPLARWADHDREIHPASVPDTGPTGRTSTDAFVAAVGGLRSYRLRATLYRPVGGAERPALTMLGAVASAGTGRGQPAGAPGPLVAAGGRVLDVPPFSQRIYSGQYPHWDGGGDAWCSPTSTSMVLAYWGLGPRPDEYAWVDPGYPDRFVHHAVRHCYDYAFQGAGNWAFNTAYAARFGCSAFVTRLRDLTEVESFVAAGIPLVASIRFAPGELTGADYPTNGHLLVVVGFTATGDVVVNDPAAPDRGSVRRTYDRAEFAAAWQGGSGGAVYVIHPAEVPLPPPPDEPNW